MGYTADNTWQKSEAGLWYLSPHVALLSIDSNASINFLELIDLFYYLAPVTMVISIIKQRYSGDVKLFYNLNQVSTYKLKYVSSVEFGSMSGTAKLYYNLNQVSTYKLKYVSSVEFGSMSGTAKLYYNVEQASTYKIKYRASA